MSDKERNESDVNFDGILEEIDSEMRAEAVPVTARQLEGWRRFSHRLGLGLRLSDPLSRKVTDWFERRYGDRLKIDNILGQIPVLIRGDIFNLRVPMFYGKVEFICDPKFWLPERGIQISVNGSDPLPRINILNCIEGLTLDYAMTLTIDERRQIMELFQNTVNHLLRIDEASAALPMVSQAKADLRACVSHLLERPPQYGLAKWAALQATEKFVKAFISAKGGHFPYTHNLHALVSLAETQGLAPISSNDVLSVECSADVRYGQVPVPVEEAVNAYNSAVKICGIVADHF